MSMFSYGQRGKRADLLKSYSPSKEGDTLCAQKFHVLLLAGGDDDQFCGSFFLDIGDNCFFVFSSGPVKEKLEENFRKN